MNFIADFRHLFNAPDFPIVAEIAAKAEAVMLSKLKLTLDLKASKSVKRKLLNGQILLLKLGRSCALRDPIYYVFCFIVGVLRP